MCFFFCGFFVNVYETHRRIGGLFISSSMKRDFKSAVSLKHSNRTQNKTKNKMNQEQI